MVDQGFLQVRHFPFLGLGRTKKQKMIMFYRSGDSNIITAMGNTFSCLYVHCVFSAKERVPILNPEVRERLWPYLGSSEQINRPSGTGPLFSCFQAFRARLLSFGPSGTGYALSL